MLITNKNTKPFEPFLFFISTPVFCLISGLHYPSLTNIIARRIPIKDRTFFTSTIFAGGPVG